MVKQKLKNLINLGSFYSHKKLPTYKKSKQENKENVSIWIAASQEHEEVSRLTQDTFHTSDHYILGLLIGLSSTWKHMKRGWWEIGHMGFKNIQGHCMPPKEDMLADCNQIHPN